LNGVKYGSPEDAMKVATGIVTLFQLAVFLSPRAAGYVRREGNTYTLGNEYISRRVSLSRGFLQTESVTNFLTGTVLALDSREFLILMGNGRVLSNVDFSLRGVEPENGDEAGYGLTALLRSEFDSLDVTVHYRVSPDKPVMWKWLVIEAYGGKSRIVRHLEVEDFELDGAKAAHQGFGQPVFLDDMFLGLEFPAGYNRCRDGRVDLTHYPGCRLDRPLTSKKVVWGAAGKGKVRRAFLDYVSTFAARPPSGHFLALSGRWAPAGRPDTAVAGGPEISLEKTAIESLESWKSGPAAAGRLLPDSYVLRFGWFNPRSWWEPSPANFPSGLSALASRLRREGLGLGLWFSLGGWGISVDWTRTRDYVPADDRFLCIADPRWNRTVRGRLRELIRDYGVNFFEFDCNNLGGDYSEHVCRRSEHGHLPGKEYAVEAGVDSTESVLRRLKSLEPAPFLALTGGTWLSPWWLKYADAVWLGGGEPGFSAVPSLSRRNSFMTYVDSYLYQDLVLKGYGFPLWGIVNRGIVKAARDLDFPGETIGDWLDNCVMAVGRGARLLEIYLTPGLLDQPELRLLQEVIGWGKRNSKTLLSPDSRMFGSNPATGEPYGFGHFADDRGLIFLRNPAPESREIKFCWKDDLGFQPGEGNYLFRQLYPFEKVLSYGGPLPVCVPLNLLPG